MDSVPPMNWRTALKRAGALAVAFGALEAVVLPRSASVLPSSRATSSLIFPPFLPVTPQNYGSGVQFRMPPVHTVFLAAALERTPIPAGQAKMNTIFGSAAEFFRILRLQPGLARPVL